jgi:hypothetical protein
VYEVSVLPSMKKGELVGHIVINMLSLMSTVMIICYDGNMNQP